MPTCRVSVPPCACTHRSSIHQPGQFSRPRYGRRWSALAIGTDQRQARLGQVSASSAARAKHAQHVGDTPFRLRRVLDALGRDHEIERRVRERERRGVARHGPWSPFVAGAAKQRDADIDADDPCPAPNGGQRKGARAATDVEDGQSGQGPSAEEVLEHHLQASLEVVGVHQRIELTRDGVVEPLGRRHGVAAGTRSCTDPVCSRMTKRGRFRLERNRRPRYSPTMPSVRS